MKGELSSETVNYDAKPCINLSHKCNLLRITLQVKEQVSEAVVRRLQFFKKNFVTSTGKHSSNLLACNSIKKRLQVFFSEICKISKNNYFYRTATAASDV